MNSPVQIGQSYCGWQSSFLELTRQQAHAEAEVAKLAVELAERARNAGVVVEIRCLSVTPLAQANTSMSSPSSRRVAGRIGGDTVCQAP
jgi:hypothetical protein